jgi:hypothetical protein
MDWIFPKKTQTDVLDLGKSRFYPQDPALGIPVSTKGIQSVQAGLLTSLPF